jgi:hypothetical protein
VEFQPVERAPGEFQCPITQEQALAMCRQAFGAHVQPTSVIELGYGTYNSTYRVDLCTGRPVILRVAPEPSHQSRAERSLMRNEHASVPYLAPIAALMPRTLAADFTHQIIGRDYLFQTLLDGVPAPDGLAAYPRPEWAAFFRQMGTITRRINAVRGDSFGWVADPRFARWSDAYTSSLADLAAALEDAGLDAGDIREAAAAATLHSGSPTERSRQHQAQRNARAFTRSSTWATSGSKSTGGLGNAKACRLATRKSAPC